MPEGGTLPAGTLEAACEAFRGQGDTATCLHRALLAAAPLIVAAEQERLRTHEHEWTRCPECKQPGQPCPCSGTVCCETEGREIVAAADGAMGERERIARHLDSLAGNYPEDVFPATSDSRDAIGGTAMRHAYRNAARSVRTGEHYA